MHEARATYSRLVLGAVLLLAVLALSMLLRERRNSGGAANTTARDAAALSIPPADSAAEKARRAAIAALGPIKKRDGINAADFYKQAMGLYAGLTDKEKLILKNWRDKADPQAADALYAKIQPIMDLLRKARKADYADWGTGSKTLGDTSAMVAQGQKVQDLAILARWESAYRFQSDPDGAVDDVAAMEAMGRSAIDSTIGFLVGNGIHEMGVSLVAQNPTGITNAAGPDLGYIVNPAAAEQSFQTGMNDEASMLQASLDEYANPATRNESQIQRQISSSSTSAEQAESQLEWLVQTEQAFATTLTEPEAQFQRWWSQKQAEAASRTLVDNTLQALAGIRTRAETSIVENSMLTAGIALEQNNQSQFQSILDPATGQPFTYTQTATGFQLGSALQNRGKPLTLSFSAPAAK